MALHLGSATTRFLHAIPTSQQPAPWILTVTFLCLTSGDLMAREPGSKTALDRYVAQPDDTYSWKVVNTFKSKGLTAFVIDLKSQTWRTKDEVNRTLWQHWLIVVKPDQVKFDTGHAVHRRGRTTAIRPDGQTNES